MTLRADDSPPQHTEVSVCLPAITVYFTGIQKFSYTAILRCAFRWIRANRALFVEMSPLYFALTQNTLHWFGTGLESRAQAHPDVCSFLLPGVSQDW